MCHGRDGMVLHVAGLDVLRVARNERHILALLILQADLPASEEFGSRLYMLKPGILEWSLELAAHDIFQTVVGDDMVMGTLVLY